MFWKYLVFSKFNHILKKFTEVKISEKRNENEIDRTHLENTIEQYLKDLGLEYHNFRKASFLIEDKEKNE